MVNNNQSQPESLYNNFLSHIEVSTLSCPRVGQLYRIESLLPAVHSVTAASLREATKKTRSRSIPNPKYLLVLIKKKL
jgi:hypothetical protein